VQLPSFVVLQQRRCGAAGFDELQWARGKLNNLRPHPPSPSALCTCAQDLKSWSGKTNCIPPFGLHVRAPPFLVLLAKMPATRISHASPRLPALFLSRDPRLEAASSREIT
jgi:hypothetical protein